MTNKHIFHGPFANSFLAFAIEIVMTLVLILDFGSCRELDKVKRNFYKTPKELKKKTYFFFV